MEGGQGVVQLNQMNHHLGHEGSGSMAIFKSQLGETLDRGDQFLAQGEQKMNVSRLGDPSLQLMNLLGVSRVDVPGPGR